MNPYEQERLESEARGWGPRTDMTIDHEGMIFNVNITERDKEGYSNCCFTFDCYDQMSWTIGDIWYDYDLVPLLKWLKDWLAGNRTNERVFDPIEAECRMVKVSDNELESMLDEGISIQVAFEPEPTQTFENYFSMHLYETDIEKFVGYLEYQLPRVKYVDYTP